jgi:putative transcriptional regulator
MNMIRDLSGRLAMLLCAAALLVGIAAAAEDKSPLPDPPPGQLLAGQLLVASAALQDPRFYHSVILLLRHDRNGAFGLIVNRPLGERSLAALLADAGPRDAPKGTDDGRRDKDAAVEGTIRVFFGGPVQPQLGFVIHSADYSRPETLTIGGLAMTANREILRDIGQRRGPAKYLFVLGYAGWGRGQLEGEIARRDWLISPADPDLVFDAERGTVWQKALARRTREM